MAVLMGSITITDLNDAASLTGFIGSNLSKTQIYNPDNNTYSPDWSNENLILTPELYISGETVDKITDASVQNVSWYIGSSSIPITTGGNYILSGDKSHILTITDNILTDIDNIDYTCEVIYIDQVTNSPLTHKMSVSFTKVSSGGGIIDAISSTPQGNVFKNHETESLTAICELWRSSVIDNVNVLYQWYIQDSGVTADQGGGIGWKRLVDTDNLYVGCVSKELTVYNSAVQGTGVFKCVITDLTTPDNDRKTYFDIVTFIDINDPLQAIIESSGGSVFKNGLGSSILKARLFQAGNEIDIEGTDGTYIYKWFKYDKDGLLIPGFGGSKDYKLGKNLNISSSDISVKSTFQVEVEERSIVKAVNQYTISELYDGEDGLQGEPGNSARFLSLTSTRYAVPFNEDNSCKDFADIVLTANQQNYDEEIIWTTSPSVSLSGEGNTRTLSTNNFIENNQITITISAGELSDTVTIVKVQDGSTGQDGVDGQDAYTVILTNESHVFAGDTTSALESTTTSKIIAYKGGTLVPSKIGTITGIPKGMSVNILQNNTKECYIAIAVSPSMNTLNGTLTIPITIEDKSFTKNFTYSLSLKGADGQDGQDGNNGIGVSSIDIWYYLSDSHTEQIGGEWKTEAPDWVDGKYIWSKTVTKFTNGDSSTSKPICITGGQGSSGVGIESLTEYYMVHTSNTGILNTNPKFDTDIPDMTPTNKYLWNYEMVKYTNGLSSKTTAKVIGVYGDKGTDGSDGKGIVSITNHYLATASGSGVTTGTSGWTDTVQSVTSTKKYLWNYETITYTVGEPTNTKPCIIGVYGDKGLDGASAKSLTLTASKQAVAYNANNTLKDSSAITLTAIQQNDTTAVSFTTSPAVTLTGSGNTRTLAASNFNSNNSIKITVTAGSLSDEVTIVKVKDGNAGSNGQDGTNGLDAYTIILSNESHTFAGNTTAAIAASTVCDIIAYKGGTRIAATIGSITGAPSGMSTSISNNGSTSARFTVSVTASMKAKNGTLSIPVTVDGKSFTKTFTYALALKGATGNDGAPGQGVESIKEQYALTSSKTTEPSESDWKDKPPAWVFGKYLWTRSVITYKNPPDVKYTTPVCDTSWEAVNDVQIGGVNLIPHQERLWEQGTINDTSGDNYPSLEYSKTRIRIISMYSIEPNVDYIISRFGTGYIALYYYDEQKKFIGWTGWFTKYPQQLTTTPNNAKYFRCVIRNEQNDAPATLADLLTLYKFQLEKGNKASADWKPCQIDINFPYIAPPINLNTDKSINSLPYSLDGSMCLNMIEGNTVQNFIPRLNPRHSAHSGAEGRYIVTKSENKLKLEIKQNFDSGHWSYISWGYINNFPCKLKPNTKYTIVGTKAIGYVRLTQGNAENSCSTQASFKNNMAVITTNDMVNPTENVVYIGTPITVGVYEWEDLMMFEGDWTNKTIPKYFEGINSVGEKEVVTLKEDNSIQTLPYFPDDEPTTIPILPTNEAEDNIVVEPVSYTVSDDIDEDMFVDESTNEIVTLPYVPNDDVDKEKNTATEHGFKLRTCGKNLFDLSQIKTNETTSKGMFEKINNGIKITKTDSNAAEYTHYAHYYKIPLKPNTDYTLSYKPPIRTELIHEIFVYLDEVPLVPPCTNTTGFKKVFNSNSAKYLQLRFDSNSNDTYIYEDIQLEEGSDVTTYEPYKESIQNIKLKEPLRKLPNGICDYIDTNRKKVIRKIGKIVFDGSEDWGLWTSQVTDTTMSYYLLGTKQNGGALVCDRFVNAVVPNNKSIECIDSDKAHLSRVRVLKSKLSTQDTAGFKKWLKANQTTVYYELANHIEEDIEINQYMTQFKNGNFLIEDTRVNPTIDLTYITSIADSSSSGNNAIGEVMTKVTETNSKLSDVVVNLDGITSTVSNLSEREVLTRKVSSFRYIRDWLNANTVNGGNHWVELQVFVGDTNIAQGIVPTSNGTQNTDRPFSVYTDGNSDSKYASSQQNGWIYLQVDLGLDRTDIDMVKVWHYYSDNRAYNHKLEVSRDGVTWFELFNSDVSGKYKETENGRTYVLNETYTESRLKKAEQKITDDSIINTVTDTITSKVNEGIIQAGGGRNLVLTSGNFKKEESFYNKWDTRDPLHWLCECLDGYYRFTKKTEAPAKWIYMPLVKGLKLGTNYVLSFKVRTSLAKSPLKIFGITLGGATDTSEWVNNISTTANTWKEFSVSFKTAENTTPRDALMLTSTQFIKVDEYIDFEWIKLEEGSKSTDWTPAPEDIEIKMNDIQVGGRNLIVTKTITKGSYLNNQGNVMSNSNWGYTDFIPVLEGKQVIVSGYTNLGDAPSTCFYNSSKGFVKGIANENPVSQSTDETIKNDKRRLVTVPSGCKFMRFSILIKDIGLAKLEEGNKPTSYTPSPEDIDAALSDTKAIADKAKTDSTNALNQLTDISTDGTLTPSEKQEIDRKWQEIVAEKPSIDRQADVYSVVKTEYTAAYNDLNTYLKGSNGVIKDLTTTTKGISVSTFNSKFNTYYNKRQIVLDTIAQETKKYANQVVNNIQVGGKNLIRNGDFEKGFEHWWKSSIYDKLEIISVDETIFSFKKALHMKSSGDHVAIEARYILPKQSKLLNGKQLTLSCWVKYENVIQGKNSWNRLNIGKFSLTCIKADGTSVADYPMFTSFVGTSDGWVKVEKTLTMPNIYETMSGNLAFRLESCVGEFWITGIQLEFGNKATDWSPCPDDINDDLTNINGDLNSTSKDLITSNKINLIPYSVNGVVKMNVLEGNTFQNVLKPNILFTTGGSCTFTNNINNVNERMDTIKTVGSHVITKFGSFKPNTTYTVSFELKTSNSFPSPKLSFYSSVPKTDFAHSLTDIPGYSTDGSYKLHQIKITTPDATIPCEAIVIGSHGDVPVNSVIGVRNVYILEGDFLSGEKPEYFEGIKSVGDIVEYTEAITDENGETSTITKTRTEFDVVTCGKNLVNVITDCRDLDISGRMQLINNKDGSITLIGKGDGSNEVYIDTNIKAYLKRGVSYRFNAKSDGAWGGGNGTDTVEGYLLSNEGYVMYYGVRDNSTFTCGRDGWHYLRLDLNKSNTTHKFWDIQITESSNSPEYEPYIYHKQTVITKEPLYKLPNGVCDYIDVTRKKVVRKIGKVVLNGSESGWYMTNGTVSNQYILPDYPSDITFSLSNNKVISTISDNIPSVKNTDIATNNNNLANELFGIAQRNSGKKGLFAAMTKRKANDLDGFKNWLKANPTTVLYELETPIEEDCTIKQYMREYKDGSLVFDNTYVAPKTSLIYTTGIKDGIDWGNELNNENLNDIFNHISSTTEEITQKYQSFIKQEANKITQSVSENYLKQTDFQTFEQSLSTTIEQTANDITMGFYNETIKQEIGANSEALESYKIDVAKYIRFKDGYIDLGEEVDGVTGKFSARLTNEKLAFKENEEEVAYISNRTMYITDAEINNKLIIGNEGRGFFDWIPRSNGNMSLKWREK